MGLFKRILCPVDFSRNSQRAMEAAAEMARQFGGTLTLMHAYVIPSYPLPEGYVLASSETVTEILSKTQRAMNEARLKIIGQGVPNVEVLMTEGAPFAEIVRVARELSIDLIIMGTHGRTGLRHALLGSVAEKVVRKAHCAVLTVRDAEHVFEKL